MIFAPPGLGKSTSAQLLSREHGFVYYECDCFLSGRNPYVPPDVENPSVAQGNQKKLIGRGAEERGELVEKVANVMKSIFKGETWDLGVWEEAVRELCKDISKERARLGGDWAIAGVLFTPRLRQIARFAKNSDLETMNPGRNWESSLRSWCWRCLWRSRWRGFEGEMEAASTLLI